MGSTRFMPCRSSAACNSRSVAATPASRLRVGSSRLSVALSMSRAKLVAAYLPASSRSRCARLRMFSLSASARSSLSLVAASSISVAVNRSAASLAFAKASGGWSWLFRSLSSCMFLSKHAPDHFRGVIHQRNDAGVVDPGRADDADRADHALAAVAVGRDNHRAAGGAEQRIVGAEKDLHALAVTRRFEQADHRFLGLERVEQRAQPLEIAERRHVLEQLRLAAHDQRRTAVAARPRREPGLYQLRGQLVELGAVALDFGGDQLP